MPQTRSCNIVKRQRSVQYFSSDDTAEPLRKKPKLTCSLKPRTFRFWEDLSKIWLTRSALEELDRRNTSIGLATLSGRESCRPVKRTLPRAHSTLPDAADYIQSGGPRVVKGIKHFARHGGPDLRDIRNYPMPTHSLHRTMSSAWSDRRKEKDPSTPTVNTKPTADTSTKPTTISAYSKNFSQHLIDNKVYPDEYEYPDGSVAAEPEGWEEINNRLRRPRPSLSPSQFSDGAFRKFKRTAKNAVKEAQVRERVLPIIEGSIPDDRCRSADISFNNLDPLTSAMLKPPKPDIYYGARPEQLDRRARDDLNEFIVPAKQDDLPIVPNFFLETKGEDGSLAVVDRQARYDGAIGARGIHLLRSYGQEESMYDSHARTITSTYHGGMLKMYAHHITAPTSEGGRPEYHMTEIKGYYMTGDADTFRLGATAYRNARDWTKEQRNQAIEQANQAAASKKVQDLEEDQEAELLYLTDQDQNQDRTDTNGQASGLMAQTVAESFVSVNTISENEHCTISQPSDVFGSQTTSELHVSHTLVDESSSKTGEKKPRKRQSNQPAQTRRKRGG